LLAANYSLIKAVLFNDAVNYYGYIALVIDLNKRVRNVVGIVITGENRNIFKPGYNDIGLGDTSSIAPHILW
jgi:hypothetical protein